MNSMAISGSGAILRNPIARNRLCIDVEIILLTVFFWSFLYNIDILSDISNCMDGCAACCLYFFLNDQVINIKCLTVMNPQGLVWLTVKHTQMYPNGQIIERQHNSPNK